MTRTSETTNGARQTLPRRADHSPEGVREAARLKEGDYLEAEVTEPGAILLRPINVPGREPTPEQEAEILAAVDEARAFHPAQRRR